MQSGQRRMCFKNAETWIWIFLGKMCKAEGQNVHHIAASTLFLQRCHNVFTELMRVCLRRIQGVRLRVCLCNRWTEWDRDGNIQCVYVCMDSVCSGVYIRNRPWEKEIVLIYEWGRQIDSYILQTDKKRKLLLFFSLSHDIPLSFSSSFHLFFSGEVIT